MCMSDRFIIDIVTGTFGSAGRLFIAMVVGSTNRKMIGIFHFLRC